MLERTTMHSRKQRSTGLAIICIVMLMVLPIIAAPLAGYARQAGAQPPAASDKPKTGPEVVRLAPSSQLVGLLRDSLGGQRATSELKQVGKDNLSELVEDKAPVYREYLVTSAVSRQYGRLRVDVFETQHQLAAFGLFTFNTGADKKNPVTVDVGTGGLLLGPRLFFYKGRFFVCISDTDHSTTRADRPEGKHAYEAIGSALADQITPANTAVTRAALLDSLPETAIVARSRRYFLGPESLNTYVEHGGEMFDFAGDTEAAAAEYTQGAQPQPTDSKAASDALKIVVVEYHTPQFATDAMMRATGYVSSLPENEQQEIILKRIGNYVVEAANVRDRMLAESLINSVQYPYTVKWLRNPLWPTNDPFRVQKAAEMLVSTFGLLGLIIGTVLVVGTVFGTTIFLKRRKRQQEVFSDAGGMLRLDIDQLETAMLGLPPYKSED